MMELRELLAEALYRSQCDAYARDHGVASDDLPPWSEAARESHLEWADDAIAAIERAGFKIVRQ